MYNKIIELLETKKEFLTNEEYEQIIAILKSAEKKEIEHELKARDPSIKEVESTNASEDLREKGNDYYNKGEYEEAILTYTEAIELNKKNHILYSNRAAAYANLGMKEEGIEDCKKAIECNENYIKAYIRLGDLYFEDDNKLAEETYSKGLKIEPSNQTLKRKLEDLKKYCGEDKVEEKLNINDMINNPEFMKMAQDMMGNKSKEELDEMLKNLMNNNKQ